MRVTIKLDDELHRQAKEAAGESGRTLSAFVEDSLRKLLAREGLAKG
jgi:predicted transcriptional regulator